MPLTATEISELADNLEYRVGRLHLEPGDILVCKMRDKIQSLGHIARIRHEFKNIFGSHNKILIIDNNVDLSIITKEELDAIP